MTSICNNISCFKFMVVTKEFEPLSSKRSSPSSQRAQQLGTTIDTSPHAQIHITHTKCPGSIIISNHCELGDDLATTYTWYNFRYDGTYTLRIGLVL
jgi:hypothetical protein